MSHHRSLSHLFRTSALVACLLATSAWAATPADTLVIARDLSTVLSLDPQEAFEVAPGDAINSLYLRLVQHDPDDFSKIIPGVAESWQATEDGKQIVFKIRSGLKFLSGNPITAQDAAFSLQRGILLDKQPAIILRQFGWSKDNVKERIKAEGEQLVLTFDEPFSTDLILSALSAGIASVVDSKLVMANERDGDLGNAWLRTRSAGAGAYRLVDWKAKDVLVLEANPNYQGGPAAKLKRVVLRHVAEPATQRLLLEKGDVDIASDLTPDQIQAIKSDGKLKVVQIPRGTIYYLALNTTNPTLAKPEVWQAMRWLVDYDGMANKLFSGHYRVNQAPLADGTPGALTEQPYSLNPTRAKELLAKAGMADGFSMTLDTLSVSPYREISQSLQSTFAQGGIKMDLRMGEPSQVLTRYRERRHDALVFVWAPDYSDPSSTMEFFSRNNDNSDQSSNKNAPWRAHWVSPEMNEQASQASHEVDDTQRLAIYGDMQKFLRDSSPFTFLLQKLEPIAMRSNVQNYNGSVTFDSTPYWIIDKAK